jgi:polysaccharide chain length determinant protein (PEP-CTERM system associated)
MLRPLMQGIAADLSVGTMAQLDIVRQTLLSRPNLEEVMRMTDLDLTATTTVEKEQIMASLRSRLLIGQRGTQDNLFSVSFTDANPQLAHDVVNALLTLFVETNLGASREDLALAQKFLTDQITGLQQQLEQAEQKLSTFQLQNRGYLPGAGNYEARLESRRTLLEQLRAERNQAMRLRDEIGGQLAKLEQGEMEQNTGAFEKKARITEMERQLEDMLTRYTEDHPDVVITKRLLEREQKAFEELGGDAALARGLVPGQAYEQLRLQLAQQNAAVDSLDQRIGQLETDITDLEALVADIPTIASEYAKLQREYELIQRNHAALLQRSEAARFAEEVDTKTEQVQFRIVEPPNVPAVPSGPDRGILRSGVLLGGFAAGAAFCAVLALIAGTVNTVTRLAEIAQRPVIGAISRVTLPGQRTRMVVEQLCFLVVTVGLLGVYLLVLSGLTAGLSDAITARLPVI